MTTKFTVLFNGTAKGGTLSFGFSETWYTQASLNDAVANWKSTCRAARSILLPSSVGIVGYRVGTVPLPGTPTRAFTVKEDQLAPGQGRAGGGADTVNIPLDSALCQIYGTDVNTVKRFWVHCLPDIFVADSDFAAGRNVPQRCKDFVTTLVDANFQFRYLQQNAPAAPINSIDGTGLVALNAGIAGAVPGATVQLLRCHDINGKPVRGKFRIATTGYTDTSHFTLLGWTALRQVAVSGTCRLVTYNYTNIKQPPDAGIGSVVTLRPGGRKAGRPFFQLRGRAPIRR